MLWKSTQHDAITSGKIRGNLMDGVDRHSGADAELAALRQRVRNLEQALHEHRALARALMAAPGDVALITDPDGVLLDCNVAAARQLGDARADLVGRSIWERLPPVVAERRQQQMHEAVRTGRPVHFEDPDGGSWFDTFIYPVPDESGSVVRVVILARDITERKQNEHRLRASEERNRKMLDAIPDLILDMSGDGVYLDIKESDQVPLSHPRSELIGRNVRDVLPPAAVEEALERLRSALETGTVQTREYVLPINGVDHEFEVRSVPLGPDEVFSIVRDITERRRAEQRTLELALERERVQVLTSFISDASHEFRTPLSIIGLKAYLLHNDIYSRKRDAYLADITHQIELLTELLDSLLVMTRLDSHEPFAIRPVDVGLLVRGLLEPVGDSAREAGLTLTTHYADQLPLVQGDGPRLQQALTHILHNAVRYTPAGGAIMVRVAPVPGRDGHIAVTVSDTGSGIEAHQLPHIFDRFFRGDMARSTRGFGLGLSIARAIIERHGGCIEVQSTVGQGSTFCVMLPVNGPAAQRVL